MVKIGALLSNPTGPFDATSLPGFGDVFDELRALFPQLVSFLRMATSCH